MIINRKNTSINENRNKENLEAEVYNNAAMTEYIAVMSDIELPGDNSEEAQNVEEL